MKASRCCNTCRDVQVAFYEAGFDFDPNEIEQCGKIINASMGNLFTHLKYNGL